MKPLFEDAKVASVLADTVSNPRVPRDLTVVMPSAPAALPVCRVTEADIDKLGEQARAGLSQVSKGLLAGVRTNEAEDFGSSLNALVVTAKGLDPRQYSDKGIVGKVRGMFGTVKERLIAQYTTIEKQMDVLVLELDKKAQLHANRIADMEQLYVANYEYHNHLELAATQGDTLLAELQAHLAEQMAHPATDSFAAQLLADTQRLHDRLTKRVDDLRRAMLLSKQNAPQIRLLQDNARGLLTKFEDVKAVSLPAWKNTFSLYVLHLEQKNTVKLLDAVDQATDDALRRGADLLRQNTESIAKARQRSVVSIETLEHVQRQLIGSFDDLTRINNEAAAIRKAAQPKLLELERELVTRFAPGQR